MSAQRSIPTVGRPKRAARPFDVAVAALAARQHGVITLAQLRDLGLSGSGVRHRVSSGRLHRVHRGVFAVGHPLLNREGHWLAAVLACGRAAALSHRSAGALWDLYRWSGRVEVLVPAGSRRAHPAIMIRQGDLREDELAIEGAIPCTTPMRTVVDLAAVLGTRDLERVVERSERLELLDLRTIGRLLPRRRGRRGTARLREALAGYDSESKFARSELELRFLRLCAVARLPPPIVNGQIEVAGSRFEVDFQWPARRLVVEVDGFETHQTRAAFERDRLRQQLLISSGWLMIRCTWDQVTRDPERLAESVRTALARPSLR